MSDETHLPTPFLVGERCYLRPLEKNDLRYIRRWANDPEMRGLTGDVLPMDEAAAKRFWDNLEGDKSRIWFAVVIKENDHVIGEAGLLRMFHPWRTTDLTLIIGEKDVWGMGYGSEAIYLLLDYAFGSLGFHRVAVGVIGFNHRALRFYEKIGFEREGLQRDGYYYNHVFHDFIMMSMLENEFRAIYKEKLAPKA
ncbi:MAG: GNAT family N-acetyltransferase [Chloroflexia bacterium]|nr:GNAT family N-acetyltransferase [Chloroflexia bacterium]